MSYPSILATIDGSTGAQTALMAALNLAKRFHAKLDLLAIAPPLGPVVMVEAFGAEAYGAQADASRKVAEEALQSAVAMAKEAGAAYEAAMIASPLGSIQEAVATRALFADLIVTPQKGQSSDLSRRVVDGALFSSPAPLLVWPESVDPSAAATLGRRPLLAWDARPQAARAARFALPMIAEAESVAVATVSHDFGDEPYEDDPGTPFVAWLARHGVNAELRQLEGSSVADTLLDEAASRNADLMVMGGYGHSQLREAIFGGVTESLLRSAPLPLLMAH